MSKKKKFISRGLHGDVEIKSQEMRYIPYTYRVLQTEFSEKFIEYLKAGLVVVEFPKGMRAITWNSSLDNFVNGMRLRMIIAFDHYGFLTKGYPEPQDALGSSLKRIAEYQMTGNLEFLIDAVNFIMIEFMLPKYSDTNLFFNKGISSLVLSGRPWLERAEESLSRYKGSRFNDFLIHAALYVLFEFLRPAHPQAHFKGTDHSESPGRKHKSGVMTHKSNEELNREDD